MSGGIRHAIVIGGGVAGLLAAVAASDRSTEVTLLERDELPPDNGGGAVRKGVPQAHHAHTLLQSGRAAIEVLCPGVQRELVEFGAQHVDFCADFAFFHYGVWKPRCDSRFLGTIQTRLLLEQVLWRRVRALRNVSVCGGTVVRRLVAAADGRRIAGVEVEASAGGGSGRRLIEGDLVIDASGRGSKLPDWLAALGYAPPPEERVAFDLRYSSCFLRLRPDAARHWRALLIYPKAPFGRRAGYIFPAEGERRHLVTLAGYFGDDPGNTPFDFLTFARTLPRRDLYDAIADAEPLSPIRQFRLPAQRRRRYDAVAALPAGVIALGDAVCVLDPLFGQGMSIAAQQAVALRDFLAAGAGSPFPPAAAAWMRLQRRLVRLTDVPWLLTSSEAFRYAETDGRWSRLFPLLQWYAQHIFEVSASNPSVYRAFMGVMHLVEPLHSVFRPAVALPVLTHALQSAGSRGMAARRSGGLSSAAPPQRP